MTQLTAALAELSDLIGVMNTPLVSDQLADLPADAALIAATDGSDITLSPAEIRSSGEVADLLASNQYTLIIEKIDSPTITFVVAALSSREFDLVEIDSEGKRRRESISKRKLNRRLRSGTVIVARHAIQCQSATSHDHHHHLPPTTRLLGLLRMDTRDILLVALFALVAGVLSLATPLAVESLVNVVSWGVYLQPLLWLGLILLVSLGLGGIFKILQTVIVEIIQRRQFVRIVGDLAHRYPLADEHSLAPEDRTELPNRFFDIMTIQKATTVLLLDGISIILSAVIGMVLLAFYHPFLLGFDLVLLLSMIGVTWLLGRGGVRTAIDESIAKYEVAHWLQDVLTKPEAFKTGGGGPLAVRQANRLVGDYLEAREKQFRVILRQVAFAIFLQVVASTALLGLGGYLVIIGELTLGQLVASELVVTVVVGAFSKAGKTFEKFYDMVAAVDKVGHLLDIETDPPVEGSFANNAPTDGPAATWSKLSFKLQSLDHETTYTGEISEGSIERGKTVALVGEDADAKALLAKSLAGTTSPQAGTITVGEVDAVTAATATTGKGIGYVGRSAIFHGWLAENVDLGRPGITSTDVRAALRDASLSDVVSKLSNGLRTHLQSGGFPLSASQQTRLMFARAFVGSPSLIVIDGALDVLGDDAREELWQTISDPSRNWTVVINTSSSEIADRCDEKFLVGPRSSNPASGAS